MLSVVHTRLGVSAAALLVLAPLIVRELRAAPPPLALLDEATTASAAAVVPAEAVSIPTLTVGSREVRVGDPAADAILSLSSVATLAATAADNGTHGGAIGRSEIRSYQLGGTNVIVVLEPFETRGTPRVAAIYLH